MQRKPEQYDRYKFVKAFRCFKDDRKGILDSLGVSRTEFKSLRKTSNQEN